MATLYCIFIALCAESRWLIFSCWFLVISQWCGVVVLLMWWLIWCDVIGGSFVMGAPMLWRQHTMDVIWLWMWNSTTISGMCNNCNDWKTWTLIIMYVKLTMLPFFIIICTLSGTTMSTNMKMKLKIGIDIETLLRNHCHKITHVKTWIHTEYRVRESKSY